MATNVTKIKSTTNTKLEEFEKEITKKRNWFYIVLLIIWWPFKIVLYPFIWVFKEFRRMASFITNKSKGPLNYEEIALVESVPVFFTFASIDLAIILGLIASFAYSSKVKAFFDNLKNGIGSITSLVEAIINIFVVIAGWIYDLVVKIILEGTWNFLVSIKLDPIYLLIIAVVGSILIVILVMIISELNIIPLIMRKLGYFGLGITELPRAIYDSLDRFWVKFLKSFGRFISGKMVISKERGFYRRIIVFVSLYAIWTFIWGVLILLYHLLEPSVSTEIHTTSFVVEQMQYMLLVILLSGILAGTLLMFFMTRILKITTRNRYNADQTLIDEIRHKSLLDYMAPKNHVPVLSLDNVIRLVDIPKQDIGSYFKDKALSDWVLSGNAIVNDKLYKDRSSYVDSLVDTGLDKEDAKFLTKALDYLTFMQKGLRNVSEYVDDIEDKKELINEDLADLRGLYNTQSQPNEA